MSTRAEIRAAIVAKLVAALPEATILDDPDRAQLVRAKAGGLLVQLVWTGVAYEPNTLLGGHDQAEVWTWEIQLLIPAKGTAAEDIAEIALTAIHDQLCPASGWRPNATGSIDCDEMNVVSNEYVGDAEQGHRLWIATYTHGRNT